MRSSPSPRAGSRISSVCHPVTSRCAAPPPRSPSSAPSAARSSIRRGSVVPGAAVLIMDEATGVPRTLETDAQGRYEAANLRPGTYRVEVVTTNFKKFERTGVLVRAAGTALVDVTLEVGSVNETVTVPAEAVNNITLDSQAIARGLDEQQLHDLPRNSRDIQSFLLLNPNVVGGSRRHPVPRRPRPTACRTSRTARPRPTPSSAPSATPRPASTRSRRLQVLSNSYSAEYGGLAGVVVTTKRGAQQLSRDGLLRLQQRQPERADLQPDARGRRAWRSAVGHARAPLGRKHRRPARSAASCSSTANYEGSNDKAIFGGGRATVPTAAMRNGDFRGTAIAPRRSADRACRSRIR